MNKATLIILSIILSIPLAGILILNITPGYFKQQCPPILCCTMCDWSYTTEKEQKDIGAGCYKVCSNNYQGKNKQRENLYSLINKFDKDYYLNK